MDEEAQAILTAMLGGVEAVKLLAHGKQVQALATIYAAAYSSSGVHWAQSMHSVSPREVTACTDPEKARQNANAAARHFAKLIGISIPE